MRRFSSKFQLSVVGELNVTPLLDLAFVLLVVFMIATPLMEDNLDLLIPTGSSAKKKTRR
jgi:biopolymer transport protein ExbD